MRRLLAVITLAAAATTPATTLAQSGAGPVTVVSNAPFAMVARRLEQAIADHRMGLVCHANAQRGAAARGVAIKGNQVMLVFRNDYAVRLLAADPAAGFEAPLRIYLYENSDGTATVTYLRPSAVFAKYAHPEVQAVAAELDPVFVAIVRQALAAP